MASREIHRQIIRLDRTLGFLIDSLYKLRHSSSIVITLTADHGVTMPPEFVQHLEGSSSPVRVDLSDVASAFRQSLTRRGLDSAPFEAFAFAMPSPIVEGTAEVSKMTARVIETQTARLKLIEEALRYWPQ